MAKRCVFHPLWLVLLTVGSVLGVRDAVRAQPAPSEAAHLSGFVGANAAVRLLSHPFLEQTAWAPPALAFGGMLTWGRRLPWQHGFGLELETNLASDGGLISGVEQLEQWVVSPLYVARLVSADWFALSASAGPSLVVGAGGRTFGARLAARASVFALAGAGGYLELVFAGFGGAESTFHPLLGLEIGCFLDREFL